MMTRGERFPVRNAVQADLERLMAIQEAAYGAALIEPIGSFSRRIEAAPDSIWVAEVAVAGGTPVPVGYLFTYRSVYGKVTPLGGDFEGSPHADTLYLHDLALIPAWRGHGIAGGLVDSALRYAALHGLSRQALIAVQDAARFWMRRGFSEKALSGEKERAHLASYGEGARYMVRTGDQR